MIRRWQAGGLLVGALPLLLVPVACTAGEPGSTTQTASMTVATTTQPEPATTTAATTVSTVDVLATLVEAIDATGDRYRYASTVETDGEVLATIDGTVSGTSFDALIDAGDVPVEYRKTGDGEWLRQANGDWTALETEPAPTSAPLAGLASPLSAVVVAEDGSTMLVDAVFAGTALGTDAEQVTVRLTVANGVVRSIEYAASLGDGIVTIVTAISDVGAVEPIFSP